MPELENLPFAEDAHLDLSDSPKPIVAFETFTPDPVVDGGQPEPVTEDISPDPQVITLPDGGEITLEKTNRGWKASADSGTGKPPEVFYGATKDELLQNVLVGKLNATRKINQLKRQALLGAEQLPEEAPDPQPQQTRTGKLSANDVFDIKAKFEENPDEALETWFRKRTGRGPEEIADAADRGDAASAELEAEAIQKEWLVNTPDYFADDRNRDALYTWLLRYKARVNPATFDAGTAVGYLYSSGHLTVENLDQAWEDLKEEGIAVLAPEPEPQPVNQPVTRRPRSGFGVRTPGDRMTQTRQVAQTEKPLDQLTDEEIRQLYQGVLAMNRTPEGKAQIQDSIAQIRSGRR